jgi:hypothetical protein
MRHENIMHIEMAKKMILTPVGTAGINYSLRN